MSTTATDPSGTSTGTGGGQISPEPETKDKGSSQREYVVLEQRAKDGPWVEIKRVTAGDVDAALNSLGESSMNQNASYVAVADRYWQPRSPKVETVTTVTWQ